MPKDQDDLADDKYLTNIITSTLADMQVDEPEVQQQTPAPAVTFTYKDAIIDTQIPIDIKFKINPEIKYMVISFARENQTCVCIVQRINAIKIGTVYRKSWCLYDPKLCVPKLEHPLNTYPICLTSMDILDILGRFTSEDQALCFLKATKEKSTFPSLPPSKHKA